MVGGEKKEEEEKKTLLLSQSSFSRQFLVCALSCNGAIKVIVREREQQKRGKNKGGGHGWRGRWRRDLWSHYEVITEMERSGGCYNSHATL